MRAIAIALLTACSSPSPATPTATSPSPAGALYGPRPIPDGAHRMSISTVSTAHGTAHIGLVIQGPNGARPTGSKKTWAIPSCVALPDNVELVSIATDVRELSVLFDDSPNFDTLNDSNCFDWDESKLNALGD